MRNTQTHTHTVTWLPAISWYGGLPFSPLLITDWRLTAICLCFWVSLLVHYILRPNRHFVFVSGFPTLVLYRLTSNRHFVFVYGVFPLSYYRLIANRHFVFAFSPGLLPAFPLGPGLWAERWVKRALDLDVGRPGIQPESCGPSCCFSWAPSLLSVSPPSPPPSPRERPLQLPFCPLK